jgi:hypothetical protein
LSFVVEAHEGAGIGQSTIDPARRRPPAIRPPLALIARDAGIIQL